ncbi:TPA: type IA DNA topoisomerase, partial [Enterococcus faecium]|nr:type IA DNA topoisomerase [Enterococcus faecium]
LSYPRTDSELITTNEFEYLKANLDVYKSVLGISIDTPCLEPKKRFVDNDKVLEHYALIPTMDIPDIANLTLDEKNIYEIVTRRACLMFAEPYKYENTKVTLDVNGL